MTSPINRELVADLARLAHRYSSDDWESLLSWLEDESRRSQLAALLRELSATSRQRSSQGKAKVGERKGHPSIEALLDELEKAEPAKAGILRELRRGLLSREILPTPNSVRMFADIAGLDRPTSKQREQLVNHLLRQLVTLPQAELEAALEKTSMISRDLGGEYDQWVDLILGRKSSGSA